MTVQLATSPHVVEELIYQTHQPCIGQMYIALRFYLTLIYLEGGTDDQVLNDLSIYD